MPLLHALLAQGAERHSYSSLALRAGISQRSVANKLREMREVDAVVGSRPVRFGPGLGLALAISCSAEVVRAGLVDANGTLLHPVEEQQPELLQLPPGQLLPRLRAAGARVLEEACADSELCPAGDSVLHLLGIAVAWPAPMDHLGLPVGRPFAHWSWRRPDGEERVVSVAERVSAEFGAPFDRGDSKVMSDLEARALCVAFDDARSRASHSESEKQKLALVVQVDERIGAAALFRPPATPQRLSFIDTRLIGGATGLAGEVGHLPVDETLIEDCNRRSSFGGLVPLAHDEAVCSCGAPNHVEALAASGAVAARLEASGYAPPTEERGGGGVISSLLDEDPGGIAFPAVHDAGRVIGAAIAGPVVMLAPDEVTFTGSLASAPLIEGILRERDRWGPTAVSTPTVWEGGSPPGFSAVRGAGLSLLRHSVYRRFEQGLDQVRRSSFDFGLADLSILRKNTREARS